MDGRIGKQVFQLLVSAAVRQVVFGSLGSGAVLLAAQDRAHLRMRIALKSRNMAACNPASTQNSDAKFLHGFPRFGLLAVRPYSP